MIRGVRWLRTARAAAAAAVSVLVVLACSVIAPSPDVSTGWSALVTDIRGYQRSIGFRETGNFRDYSADQEGYPYCGYTPKLTLPYSYQDPAIRWLNVSSEEECRRIAGDADMFHGTSEALGEIGSPVTPSMLSGKLDRFVYLVIHEDCHDQFDLPFGIEEALCELISYRGMAEFAASRYRWYAGEGRAIRRYAEQQSGLSHATVGAYDELAAIYARHERGEITRAAALSQREAFFRRTARALQWNRGALNNVSLANNMTYTRHYALMESVYEFVGRDLSGMVRFFQRIDAIKPQRQAFLKQMGVPSDEDIRFVKAYEDALVLAIRRTMVSGAKLP
jgi:hypothetical protein